MDEQELQQLEQEGASLTARQQAFVEHFVVLRNGTKAAIESAYAPGSAHVEASRLLRNAKVRAAVDALSKDRGIELDIDHTCVLERLNTDVERCLQVERVTVDKVPRAELLADQADTSNVRIVKCEWYMVFIKELTAFPLAKFKVQVDAASGAYNKLSSAVTPRLWQL